MEKKYTNKHHILHHRAYHETNKDNRWLRNSLGMIATMDVDAHNELHKECPGVPPLDLWTANRTRGFYIPDANPLVAMDNFKYAVELAMQSPKTHEIERNLSELAIHAVELQRPFIKEGLVILR